MNRQIALVIIIITGTVGAMTAFAQRNYTQVMKEIAPTFQSLKKNLDSNSAEAAVQDADKLQGLFKETESFWAKFNTKDAMDYAKRAQKAFGEVSAKAKANDMKAAQTAYGTVGSVCGDCHFSHREDTGKGFVIKP